MGAEPQEVVADKGYHANKTMTGVKDRGLRSYVSEPDRGKRLLRRAGREAGARVCAPARDRRHAPRPPSRAGEHPKTVAPFTPPPSTSGLSCASASALALPGACRASRPLQAALATRVTTRVLRFFHRIRRHFAAPGPDLASSHTKTRFLQNNAAPASPFFAPSPHPLETRFFHGLLA